VLLDLLNKDVSFRKKGGCVKQWYRRIKENVEGDWGLKKLIASCWCTAQFSKERGVFSIHRTMINPGLGAGRLSLSLFKQLQSPVTVSYLNWHTLHPL
jgi:hypothetical protein